MSIGGSSGSSQTQLDPQIKADWQQLYGQAQQTAAQPTPQQQVAPLTDGQKFAIGQAPSLLTAGQGATGQAVTAAGGVAGYQAPTVGVTKAAAPDSSVIGYNQVQGAQQGNLQPYLNPYTSDVFDASLNQLNLAREQALNSNSSTATQQGGEGAFDGSRAGVSDALTNQGFAQEAGSLAAGLNSQNFTQAQQAAETYGQLGQQAQEANQAAALAKGETVYGGDLTTAIDNAAAGNTASLANAQNSVNAAQERLGASSILGGLGAQQQNMDLTGINGILGAGSVAQQQQQAENDAAYQNEMNARNLPLQTLESAFGIIPSTNSGSSTHSSGKSGQIG